MPRPATGSIEEHEAKDGRVYRYLRFAANGKRQTLRLGAVTREEAERQLSYVMADVARGTWRPPVPAPKVLAAEAGTASTFHGFANEWWLLNQAQLAAKTREDYTWRLQKHLLPYFGEMRLDAITFNTVERYIAAKLAEAEKIRDAAADGRPLAEEITDKRGRTFIRTVRPLSARAINMTVTLLAAILESAVERELITRNPAKGKRRRVRERAPARSHLEEAAQIEALLDAAGELDRDAQEQGKHIQRRAMIATLTFAGLRIGELLALRWRDVEPRGRVADGRRLQDRRGTTQGEGQGRAARRAAGGSRVRRGGSARAGVRNADRQDVGRSQRPQSGARPGGQAREREPSQARSAAAAGEADTALAAPHVRERALRARRVPSRRDG